MHLSGRSSSQKKLTPFLELYSLKLQAGRVCVCVKRNNALCHIDEFLSRLVQFWPKINNDAHSKR